MSPTIRLRSLFESGVFSDADGEERPGLAALANLYLFAGSDEASKNAPSEWQTAFAECEALFKITGGRGSSVGVDEIALRLAKLIYSSYGAGFQTGLRDAAHVQGQKARAAKKRGADERWRIIRRAIVVVCRKQNLKLTASGAFAESIRDDVIKAAQSFGLSDLRRGTSTRSIERHIASLVRRPDLISAILEECE